ncbi:DNA-binding SARP family transcriptional activator [Kitasatospora sp. MAP12-15]|uniref:AfsR/SARP family transcriptional regulator n=1 Tax=unclassified Kitasatospora TaxID=2633591 RepID=UPI002477122A|nr:BTAD domain-containing putative transcriptional regulator [Kitasatospora sp. MAP12-44]MDH6113747.1 DNA-binding SARP family transcriptional activator [Kitasatospora sp. MAP12-44]
MLEISLLGSLRVCRDEEDVTPSAPKLRQVLALLVLNTNALVSLDQLCEELWEDSPPLTAVTTLQTYIYQLRRRLRLASGQTGEAFGTVPPSGRPALLTRVGGYELQLDDKKSVDAFRFERLVEQGKAEHRSGAREQAAGTLQAALALWHGQALVGVADGRRLSAWSTQLEERRRGAMERRFAIELELGRHRAVLDELSDAVRSHPTDEALAGQLMRAMQRCGRRPEALDVFRALRTRLVDDLGLEPSDALQRLHQEVLTDRGGGAGTTKAVPRGVAPERPPHQEPAQLPAQMDDFVGRESEIAQLEDYLGDSDRAPQGSTRVVEVHGAPGVGKTSFAIRVAHRVRQYFPDGQLYVDLSEAGKGTAVLAELLRSSLSSFGLAKDKLPTGIDELSRLLRSHTADRRMLIVVDEVVSASQLRAFIPGGPGCAVISTNRYRSHSLGIGRKVMLPALGAADCRQLYNRVAGGRRWQDEPAAVGELLRMCEGLPLVIRAVAERLTARPGWSAVRLLERLRNNESAILKLPAGTQSLVSTIESSYRHLPDSHRDLLSLLTCRQQAYWQVGQVAELLSRPTGDAETLLEDLVDVHVMDELPNTVPEGRLDIEPAYTVPRLTRQALLLLQRCSAQDPQTPQAHDGDRLTVASAYPMR